MKKPFSLSHAVLASTFFLAPFAQADTIIAAVNPPAFPPPLETSTEGNIEITPAGALVYNGVASVIIVDATATITIDPNNTQAAAINSTGGGIQSHAISITSASSVVSVGQNSTIKAGNIALGGDGVTVSAAQPTIVNSGTITASGSAVNIAAGATKATVYNQQGGTLSILANSLLGKPAVLIAEQSAILNNAGTITSNSNQGGSNAIQLNAASAAFTNLATGVVSHTNAAAGAAAIAVTGTPVVITNSGQITSAGGGGISLGATAKSAVINNNQGATIQGEGAGIDIGVGATGASIANTGTITSMGANGITVSAADFNGLLNNAGGLIQTQKANQSAISLAAAVAGNIMNSGTIEGTAQNTAGITITSVLNGSITNTASGIIRSVPGAGNAGQGLLLQGTFFTIDNNGTIQGTDNAVGIQVNNTATAGTINNSGTIQSDQSLAIFLSGSLTQINNTGKITSNNAANPTILVNPAAVNITFPGGFINNGTISASAGGSAINLTGKANVTIPLTQNSGTITGNIFLASSGGPVFTQNGGTIVGDVHATEPTPIVNTLNLKGGVITGTVHLGGQGAGNAGDILNLSGTIVNTVQGGDSKNTFNITGGQINTALVGSGVVGDVLNINNTFSTNAAISKIETINVNAGTFTVNGTITTLPTTYNILAGATLVANNAGIQGQNVNNLGSVAVNQNINFGGMFNNTGSLLVRNGITLTTDGFANNAGGTYVTEIAGVGSYGKIAAGGGGANLLANSVVQVQLTGGGAFIPLGTAFDVITAPVGNLADASTLGQPASAILVFNKQVVGGANDVLRLTVTNRNSYSTYANSDLSQGVVTALDTIVNQGTTNPELITLLGQLDFLPTGTAVHTALESLAPPLNYALTEGSHAMVDTAFGSLHERLEKLRHLAPLGAETYRVYRPMEDDEDSGYSYGDTAFNRQIGAWVKGYGVVLDQRRRHQYEGYLGSVSGVAIGADVGSTEGLGIVGGAISYSNAGIKGKSDNQNIQNINSFQGTFYSWFSAMDPFYVDTLVGFSINKYKTRRNVAVGNYSTSGFADFTGFQYGAEIEAGYAFLYQTFTVAPVARVKVTRLEVGSYTETGMGGTGLAVQNAGLNEFVTGIGFRALTQKDFAQAIYATEFSAMILYDFYGARERTVSNFLGGGPAFPTQGIKPAQTITLFGLGFNAYTNDRYSFTVKYELELRDHFFGHTGYLQLRYQWG